MPDKKTDAVTGQGNPLKSTPEEAYIRDPVPTFYSGAIAANGSVQIVYTNGLNEVSEMKSVWIQSNPSVTFSLQRTINNNPNIVVDVTPVSYLPWQDAIAATWRWLRFREVERDVPLTIHRNQKVTLVLQNPTAGLVSYIVKFDKNQVMFYRTQGVNAPQTGGGK